MMNRIISLLIIVFLVSSCSDFKGNSGTNEESQVLRNELDSLKSILAESKSDKIEQVTTFLTFQENNAEEAMTFYIGLFDSSKIIDIQRYGKDSPAKEGTILMATFELNGSKFACSDSYIKHDWSFTPAVSLFIEFTSDEKMINVFNKLSEGGKIFMPLDNYGFSKKFGFVEDKFGVSWQLNLN